MPWGIFRLLGVSILAFAWSTCHGRRLSNEVLKSRSHLPSVSMERSNFSCKPQSTFTWAFAKHPGVYILRQYGLQYVGVDKSLGAHRNSGLCGALVLRPCYAREVVIIYF